MTDPHAAGKRAAARAAADLVESGATIGLGTGSTFRFALERLAERIREEGLDIRGVPTSAATAALAEGLGVPLVSLDEVDGLDLAIDGADEVDRNKDMIKGGGGALLREKIVAAAAREMVVVVSDNKLVEHVGDTFPLPVEVVPFGVRPVMAQLTALGLTPTLRRTDSGEPTTSDNGNRILDCAMHDRPDPRELAAKVAAIPGVVEHGLFLGMAGRVYVSGADGDIRIL